MMKPSPRSPRGPFGREQWLARNEARRIGEWTTNHMETLQAISPRLMHRFRQGKLSTNEFERAVEAHKRGGHEYVTWAEKNIIRPDPCYNPCAIQDDRTRAHTPRPLDPFPALYFPLAPLAPISYPFMLVPRAISSSQTRANIPTPRHST